MPEYVPYYGRQLIFHAKDIWHGSGLFERSKWSREKRLAILKRLAAIPAQFNLPLVVGYTNRDHHAARFKEQNANIDQKAHDLWAHLDTFLSAVRRVEKWMETNASDEVAMLIAEDTDRIKKIMAALHSSYTDRMSGSKKPGLDEVQALIQPMIRDDISKFEDYWGDPKPFRSSYIVDAVHFAKKEGSLLLQIADHCAFFAKRKLMKCPHISPLYEKIAPQIAFQSPCFGIRKPLAFRRRDAVASLYYADGEIGQPLDMGLQISRRMGDKIPLPGSSWGCRAASKGTVARNQP